MTAESMLTSLFLKRNLRSPAPRGLSCNPGVQAVEDPLERPPRPMCAGVRQRRARRRLDPQAGQLALAVLEAAFDLTQRVLATKLATHHRDRLAPVGKPPQIFVSMHWCNVLRFKMGTSYLARMPVRDVGLYPLGWNFPQALAGYSAPQQGHRITTNSADLDFASALDEFLVTQVGGALEVQPHHHQTDGQPQPRPGC